MSKILIGKYEATIYPERNGYTGAISLGLDDSGNRVRVKRKGRTKALVKDKLKEVVEDLEAGVTAKADYTVEEAINDFLDHGMKGKASSTVDNYRSLAKHHIIPQLGKIKLKQLTADRLDQAGGRADDSHAEAHSADPGAGRPSRAGS